MHELLIFLARSMGQFLKRWLVCSYEFFFFIQSQRFKIAISLYLFSGIFFSFCNFPTACCFFGYGLCYNHPSIIY